MWVKVEDDYYNTDHILSVEKKEDAGVYYNIRFADGKETGFNPEQIKPLLDAVEKIGGPGRGGGSSNAGDKTETAKEESANPPVTRS